MRAGPWRQANVVVTGAASGIGFALSRALVHRGANVWMADIQGAKVEHEAIALGPAARACSLDVRDAAAVRALIEGVARDAGRIDYLFNNAGIGVAGETDRMSLGHFDRLIDVNLRGVINGVAAAYPLMIAQRSGHIVNTASLAGLVPAPLMSGYAMTKHAVVGLTASLREEASVHGVRVSALCPGVIETPLLDAGNPADLARIDWAPGIRRYLTRLAGAPYAADRLAAATLRGVQRNRGLIVVPAYARLIAIAYRLFPWLVQAILREELREEMREKLREELNPRPRAPADENAPSPVPNAGLRPLAGPKPNRVAIARDVELPTAGLVKGPGRPSVGFAKRAKRLPSQPGWRGRP